MKLEVTRDVVSDLWSLCQAGSASPDSRALVKAYLVEDGSFAAMLKRSKTMSSSLPDFHLSPDAERRLLDDARDRARTKLLVIGGSIAIAGFLALIALVALLVFLNRGIF
jgi:hypothetical protein